MVTKAQLPKYAHPKGNEKMEFLGERERNKKIAKLNAVPSHVWAENILKGIRADIVSGRITPHPQDNFMELLRGKPQKKKLSIEEDFFNNL